MVAGVVGLVVLVVGGTWVYINVIKEEAPERLTFESRDATTTTTTAAGATTAPGSTTTAAGTTTASAGSSSIDGTWQATDASELGYRVKETLFGQST